MIHLILYYFLFFGACFRKIFTIHCEKTKVIRVSNRFQAIVNPVNVDEAVYCMALNQPICFALYKNFSR